MQAPRRTAVPLAPCGIARAVSIGRVVALAAVLGTLATACGGRLTGAHTRDANASSQKECAACAKMCEVAGDAEKNAAAVADCQADCQKKCANG